MLYEIAEAVPHPDHTVTVTVTVTWADGVRSVVSFAPFLATQNRLRGARPCSAFCASRR